jgi:hypothetical protein
MGDAAWSIRNFGVRGVKLGDTSVVFAKDKIVVSTPNPTEHYTLHLGSHSGVLDVHRTWEDEHGQRRETLFAIRHADLPNILNECGSYATEIQRILLPFPYTALAAGHYRVVSLFPTTPRDIAEVTTKTHRNLAFCEDRLRAYSRFADNIEDLICDFPDGAFALLDARQWRMPVIGVGTKSTSGQFVRLWWCSISDALRVCSSFQQRLLESARKHAIKPETYGEYSFLTPRPTRGLCLSCRATSWRPQIGLRSRINGRLF